MLKLGYLLFYLSVIQNTLAQHYINRTIDVDTKDIEIICHDIDNLRLVSTPNRQLTVYLEDVNDAFTNIDIYKKKDKLIIKQKEKLPPQEPPDKFCVEQPNFASYVISVPNNSRIFIAIETGNLNITNFKGFINAQVETGTVLLNNNLGEINLRIIDGSVRSLIKNAQLKVSTNLGNIESSLSNLKLTKNNKTLTGIYKNNLNKLEITAVKANIYLESVKE